MKQKKKDKRELIIEAAAAVFAEKGYNSATISEIAQKAGVGKGTVYEYFKSKTELFGEVFEWYNKFFAESATLSLSSLSGPVAKRLTELSNSIMKNWSDHMEIYTLTMEFWSASASSEVKDRFKEIFRNVYREFRGLIEGFIREGIAKEEFREDLDVPAIAASLVGTWDALLLQGWFDEDFDPVAVNAGYMTTLIRGINKEE
jgi:AcrR family transcriptional regulator